MIANIAVYIEVSWVVSLTEHDRSDLAGTLGIATRGLCDGRHSMTENWVAEQIGSRFQEQAESGRHRNGGGFRMPAEARPARSLFNCSSIALGLQKTLLDCGALAGAHDVYPCADGHCGNEEATRHGGGGSEGGHAGAGDEGSAERKEYGVHVEFS